MMTGKMTASPCRNGTTSPFDCARASARRAGIRPPVKSSSGALSSTVSWREDQVAVEILVQAVVVADLVFEQKRRRPFLAGGVALRQISVE